MKKNKKKLRGMTLIEVIIAIVIFALLGMVLMGVGNATDAQRRAAIKTNNKVSEEGPLAEAQSDSNAILIDRDFKIKISKTGGSPVEISGRLYSIEDPLVDEYGNIVVDADGNVVPDPNNDPGHFKFIEVDSPMYVPDNNEELEETE